MALKKSFSRIFPVEHLIIGTGTITIFIYLWLHLAAKRPIELYLERLKTCFECYVAGLLLVLAFYLLKNFKEPILKTFLIFSKHYLKFSDLLISLRLINVVSLLFVIFIHLKNVTPYITNSYFDKGLLNLENYVFAQYMMGEYLLRSIPVTWIDYLSILYFAFFNLLALTITILLVQRDKKLTFHFFNSFCTCWILGIFFIFAFPTLGPVFIEPDRYLTIAFSEIGGLQKDMWSLWKITQSNPQSSVGIFMISGFPSLHIAVVLLCTIFLERVNKYLGWLCSIFYILTWLTTLIFGWHYVIDNIGGVILALGCDALFKHENNNQTDGKASTNTEMSGENLLVAGSI